VESKGEFVIDIGQLCHHNFGKDSTCRNSSSPEAAPCLVMNELYGPLGVQAESDCDGFNDVCVRVCVSYLSVMKRLTANGVLRMINIS